MNSSVARLHLRRTKYYSEFSLGGENKTCGLLPLVAGSEGTEHHKSVKGLQVGRKV